MTDERQGYPSASSMERLKLCPGSHKLIASLPERPRKEDAWTTAGTEAHEELASGVETENLTVEACREIGERFIGSLNVGPYPSEYREIRLWNQILSPSVKFSGKPDLVVIWLDENDGIEATLWHAAIIDWKTGRKGAPDAAENLQLRTLAVLVDANYGPFETITVAAVQPWVAGQLTVAKYERAELIDAEREIVEIIQASQKPDAPRRLGPRQCEYCPALAFCDEARRTLVHAPLNRMKATEDASKESIKLTVGALSTADLMVLLDRFPTFEKYKKAVESEAKFRLKQDPSSVPGYALKPGDSREKIVEIQMVRERAIFRKVHPNRFLKGLSLTKKSLSDMLKETGLKGKALEAQVEECMDGCTESKPTAARLVRVDGKEIE